MFFFFFVASVLYPIREFLLLFVFDSILAFGLVSSMCLIVIFQRGRRS